MNSMRDFDMVAEKVRDHHIELLKARSVPWSNSHGRSLMGQWVVLATLAALGLIPFGVW